VKPSPRDSEGSGRRILIIKPSSLGDVIHALPTVNLIRRKFPEAHIAWLINHELSSLLQRCPIINERIEFHRRAAATWLPLLRQLRRQNFDIVVDLQGLLRSGLFAFKTGAPRRIGLSDSREGARLFHNEIVPVPRCHAVDRYLLAARHLGCDSGPVEFPIGSEGLAPSRSLIAINATARWKTKLWGDDKFAALIQHLPADRLVLTGTAADAPHLTRLGPNIRNLAGKTDLFELAQLYQQCCVVITNDSGPMHLAAAVGTPVVAIFGPTDPALTGPYGRGHIVLRAGIPCSPCFKDHCTNPVAMECMRKVTVEQVLKAAQQFI
jgi:lipopolysaccharide heptosyltransferase I